MRVGVYIDGLNLYYGGRSRFGRGTSGWRWLDLRLLGERLLTNRNDWTAHGAAISRVVYCTALVDTRLGQGSHRRQQVYLAALRANSSFDHLEQGRFALRLKTAQLATRGRKGRPVVHTSRWPIMVRDSHGRDVPDARFVVSYLNSEEKATDVNVASHLLFDVLTEQVEAAIVISNDSDLRLPIRLSRQRVPVGTVNPSKKRMAGDLKGQRDEGPGMHWWYQLTDDDFLASQLPHTVGPFHRPPGW